ncbi:MAG: IS3 family transposase [Solirubrobacterales bacterium]
MEKSRRGRGPYPPEFRREAVELYRSSGKGLKQIAEELGIAVESLRSWNKQHEIDVGEREGLSSEEREELRRLRKENARLKQEREILKRAGGLLRKGDRDPVSVYRMISAERASFPVSIQCELLGVSRSGYYDWEGRGPSARALADAELTGLIREIHEGARGVYGAPRIHAELRMTHGIRVGRKRVERLMAEAGISGLIKRRRKGTTIRVPGVRIADDLVRRDFQPPQPNLLWLADITYLRSWEGWLYLGAVQDAFSRSIVGWSMAEHMRAELVVDALEMGVSRRQPDAGLVHHSDQGSQYVSLGFGQAARNAGIAVSMGSKGDCYDNAVAESFFATLKKELVYRHGPWRSRRELASALFDYIEVFYNRERRHSTLGYLSPSQFEEESLSTKMKKETT